MDGAELVCLPEYCGGLRSEGGLFAPPTAPEDRHPVLAAFRGFASEVGVWMLIGSVAVDGPGDRLLNRGYVVDDRGRIRARYDKVHSLRRGPVADPALPRVRGGRAGRGRGGGGYPVGSPRHDHLLRPSLSPSLPRARAGRGPEILVVPAAFHQGDRRGPLARAEPRQGHRKRRGGGLAVRGGRGAGRWRRLRPLPRGLAVGRGPPRTGARGWGTLSPRWTSRALPRRAGKIPSLEHDRPFSDPAAEPSERPRAAA